MIDATVETQLPRSTGSRRLPSLDGWRALSIVLVLGAHCRATAGFPTSWSTSFKWLFDGDLGVRIFFVISGFLITWLLLQENASSGHIDLRRFYIRRALRILPVYFAFLGVLATLQYFTKFQQPTSTWIRNLTFTTNFNFGSTNNWTSGHLWSLAVEEQFYLVWPLVVATLRIGVYPSRAVFVLLIPIFVGPLSRVVTYLNNAPIRLKPLFSDYSFFNYCDSLAIGCGTALLLFLRPKLTVNCLISNKITLFVLCLALVFSPYILTRLGLVQFLTVPFGATVQGIGIAILVAQSTAGTEALLYSPLNAPMVQKLGVLSYSIYIWQQLFSTKPSAYGLPPKWWLMFPYWLLPAIATALLSFYFLERPFFNLRNRFRH